MTFPTDFDLWMSEGSKGRVRHEEFTDLKTGERPDVPPTTPGRRVSQSLFGPSLLISDAHNSVRDMCL